MKIMFMHGIIKDALRVRTWNKKGDALQKLGTDEAKKSYIKGSNQRFM